MAARFFTFSRQAKPLKTRKSFCNASQSDTLSADARIGNSGVVLRTGRNAGAWH
jgi:hypothetical protein